MAKKLSAIRRGSKGYCPSRIAWRIESTFFRSKLGSSCIRWTTFRRLISSALSVLAAGAGGVMPGVAAGAVLAKDADFSDRPALSADLRVPLSAGQGRGDGEIGSVMNSSLSEIKQHFYSLSS